MQEAPSPPPLTVIPSSDWEQTPLSVKQWVESREERIQELEQQLTAQQQHKRRVTSANPVTARKTESQLIQFIETALIRSAPSPKAPAKKK